MAVVVVTPPDFKYSGLYYGEIFSELTAYRRAKLPELNDEDPNDPFTQVLTMLAATMHYQNVLLDHVAQETLLPTARLRDSVRGHLSLIGYRVKEAVPATVDIVARLGSSFSSTLTVNPSTRYATRPTSTVAEVVYEERNGLTIPRTDQAQYVYEDDGGSFTDRTDLFNAGTGAPTALWGGSAAAGDALYIGHDAVTTDAIQLTCSTLGGIWDENDHVWEYYDQNTDNTTPNGVTLGSGQLTMTLTNLLGTNNRAGTEVVVVYAGTGATETATSFFSGGINQVTVGTLGQSTPSTAAGDYVVGSEWKEVPSLIESATASPVEVDFQHPEDSVRKWDKATVNGVEAYWLRLRIINANTSPSLDLGEVDTNRQYVKFSATQGRTVTDNPIGASDGSADQSFVTTRSRVIDNTVSVLVDEGSGFTEYAQLENFLTAGSNTRAYTLNYDQDSRAVVTFGDGANGFIPPVGSDVRIVYRVDASTDGNVGANEVVIKKATVSQFVTVTNPRPATGWKPPEGSTDDSLSELKIQGPASLRLRQRIVTADDLEDYAEDWAASDGSEPLTRTKTIVNGYGDKTYELIVCGAGGAFVPQSTLDAFNLDVNGDPLTGQGSKVVSDYVVTAVNYARKTVNLSVTVKGGDKSVIEAALRTYLLPDATNSDGEYEHEYGGTVFATKLIAVVFAADDDVENVVSGLTADIALANDELPYPGTITVTVT